jgi:hypothetical protein
MPTEITINGITGTSPYDVYVCDPTNVVCVYIDRLNPGDIPNTFDMPEILSSLTTFNVKVVDKDLYESNNILVV